jgi:hypothetical protein
MARSDLIKLGFSDNHVVVPERLIINLMGLERTGKNHFAFTGPEPIIFVSLDRPSEATVKKFHDNGVDILTYRYPVPKMSADMKEETRRNLYLPIWERVKGILQECWNANTGTLVVDTATECNELSTLARFGKISQIPPHLRQELNQEWREMLSWAYAADQMSTVLIHKMGEKFDSGGLLERKGWGKSNRELEYAVEANVETRFKDGAFSIHVVDCGPNMDVAGLDLYNDEANLQALLGIVYG